MEQVRDIFYYVMGDFWRYGYSDYFMLELMFISDEYGEVGVILGFFVKVFVII